MNMLSNPVVVLLSISSGLAVSCGGGQPKETAPTLDEKPAEVAEPQVQDEGESAIQMEGLLGTIPQHSVEKVMKRNEGKILECFAEAFEILEEIEGSLEIWMEVGAQGTVDEVYLRDGTLGAKVAEDCIVEVVSRFKFPEPSGGSHAEIIYPMEFEEPYGHPEPHNWGGAKSSEVLKEHSADLERCLGGKSGVKLTLYVYEGGKVVSAGATSETPEMYDAAQCLAQAAMAWIYPDPGERPAKAVLEL